MVKYKTIVQEGKLTYCSTDSTGVNIHQIEFYEYTDVTRTVPGTFTVVKYCNEIFEFLKDSNNMNGIYYTYVQ